MTDCRAVGSIQRTAFGRFLWTIPEFSSLKGSVGYFYWSPDIHHLDNVWNLRVYPNGTRMFRRFTTLQLWRQNVTAVKPVRFSLAISANSFSEEDSFNNHGFDTDTCLSSTTFQFMRRRILLKRLKENSDVLSVSLAIWMNEPTLPKGRTLDCAESDTEKLTAISTGQKDCPPKDSSTESSSDSEEEDCAHNDPKGDDPTLQQHLEDMLLTGEDHDLTLEVKHLQFRAHKCMLRARSPVFAAMFKHKMKESTDGSISIDDCDPESFGEFLHYIYTGKVKNLSVSNAMGLYYAGDKYDFSGLKEMCLEFLKTSLSTAAISDVITLAIKHGEDELLECAMAFVAKHLEEIISSVEWQRFLLDNPIQANEICLKALKARSHKA